MAGVDPELAEATVEVARHLGMNKKGGGSNEETEAVRTVESDLLRQLRSIKRDTKEAKDRVTAMDLKDVVDGMRASFHHLSDRHSQQPASCDKFALPILFR